MEALLLSLSNDELIKYVLRPTLQYIKKVGIDITSFQLHSDVPFLILTESLPKWLLETQQSHLNKMIHFQHILAIASGGGSKRRNNSFWRILVMYVVLLVSALLCAGTLATNQIQTTHVSNFQSQALAIAKKQSTGNTMQKALTNQRFLDISTLSKYNHVVQDFVDVRYDAIKDRQVNDYHRMQAHNAYETIDWFASNQSMGFIWLLVTCDRVDLDIKLNANGEVVMYHAPKSPRALAWALSKIDPNHVRLSDALEWVALVVSHYPKHMLMVNIENHDVPSEKIQEAFEAAGLLHKMAKLTKRTTVPTVKYLTEQGQNLLVFIDDVGTSSKAPREDYGLHLTRNYFNENDYHCKDIQHCSQEHQIIKPRTDWGSRKHIDPAFEFKEINAFANSQIGLPMTMKQQEAFDMRTRYELANSFNPWGIANSTINSVGINKDFVRLDTDVWYNLMLNLKRSKQANSNAGTSNARNSNSKIRNLKNALYEIHQAYTKTNESKKDSIVHVHALEFANTILHNSAITRFIVMQTIYRFQALSTDHASTTTAHKFFKHEYKTRYNDYLPLMPQTLFCEICIVLMGAGAIKSLRQTLHKLLT